MNQVDNGMAVLIELARCYGLTVEIYEHRDALDDSIVGFLATRDNGAQLSIVRERYCGRDVYSRHAFNVCQNAHLPRCRYHSDVSLSFAVKKLVTFA